MTPSRTAAVTRRLLSQGTNTPAVDQLARTATVAGRQKSKEEETLLNETMRKAKEEKQSIKEIASYIKKKQELDTKERETLEK